MDIKILIKLFVVHILSKLEYYTPIWSLLKEDISIKNMLKENIPGPD